MSQIVNPVLLKPQAMPQPYRHYFITHPNVVISNSVPVPQWPLSVLGQLRMQRALDLPWIMELTAIYCSAEQKAIDSAQILSNHLGLPFCAVQSLGENDRSSTGFLPPPEFEKVADTFFAQPHHSVRGWEKAMDAQQRIVQAVAGVVDSDKSNGPVAIVSHGAVGTLLYCHLTEQVISRQWDQPANGGGNYFQFSLVPRQAFSHWQAIDGTPSV